MSPWSEFLQSHVTTNDQPSTNTGLPPARGKWSVSKEDYARFLDVYTEQVRAGCDLHMTELHEAQGPLVIDLDFRFDIDIGLERKYKEEDIASVVELYHDQIKHYFDTTEVIAYVFEKPGPVRQDGYIKDGIHIMYPHIVSKPEVQYEIRENVILTCKSKDTLGHLNLKKELTDVFDEAVIKRSGWMMYGSHKHNQEPYKLTKIFNTNCEETLLPETTTRELVELFSIRNHESITTLKVEPSRRRSQISGHSNPPIRTGLVEHSDMHQGNIDAAKKLVSIIGKDRAESRDSWIDVGIVLFNIDNQTLLDTWEQFSKRSNKYKNGECAKQWRSFENHRGQKLTIASLHHWAKIDNPSGYLEIRRNDIHDILHRSLDCTHYDVATLMYAKYRYEFVCTSIQHNTWYQFKGHRWNEAQKACELRTRLSQDIAAEYLRLSAFFKKRSIEAPEDVDLVNKNKQCEKLLKQVKDRKFKENVVKECGDLFSNTQFERKLDANVNLIGFTNGVYDLENLVFRDGRPEDFVSYSTNMDYEHFDPDDETTQEMLLFIEQVLPDKHVRKYVLLLIASFLTGKTGEQKFHVWTGTGSNGKSKLLDLIEAGFGDYATKLPVTVLTQKRAASSSATPEIAKCKGKRFVSFQEPEKEDKIHVGHMKELTGGDTIMARPMYKEPVEFKPMFKMILACNDLPSIPANDGGTWRRVRVVHFESKFVDNPDPNNPLEQKKDINIADKLSRWKVPFMSLLVEFYAKYKSDGIKEPDVVMHYTRKYQQRSDAFLDFIEDNIETVDDVKSAIMINEMYTRFKMWFQEAYNSNPPSRTDFRDYMDKKFGTPHKRFGWRNLRFVDLDAPFDDDDEE